MMVISLGNLSYAAHKIALTAESISFNLGFAFSFAASALVGQELGKGSSQKAFKRWIYLYYYSYDSYVYFWFTIFYNASILSFFIYQ